MDELVVLRHLGKSVYPGLVDQVPGRHANLRSDKRFQLACGKGA